MRSSLWPERNPEDGLGISCESQSCEMLLTVYPDSMMPLFCVSSSQHCRLFISFRVVTSSIHFSVVVALRIRRLREYLRSKFPLCDNTEGIDTKQIFNRRRRRVVWSLIETNKISISLPLPWQ